MSRKDRRSSEAADRRRLRLVVKGEAPAHKPVPSKTAMACLVCYTAKELEVLGLVRWTGGPWAEPQAGNGRNAARMGMALFLFPASWYAHIPGGTEIVDVNGNLELFVPNETENDAKHGLLAYGIMVKL